MKCFHPITIRVSQKIGGLALPSRYIEVPCGKCPACMKRRQQDWAIRIQHEAQSCISNGGSVWFTTLTYDDEHLPYLIDECGGELRFTLDKTDVQKFNKSLRKYFDTHYDSKFRFFACGEYGDKFERPHYHIVLFFDRVFDFDLVRSVLDTTWKNGLVLKVVPLTVKLSEYVAKYCCKRFGQDYEGIQPPFSLMSRMPALGSTWIKDNSDYYRTNKLFHTYNDSGTPYALPRYYKDRIFTQLDKSDYANCMSRMLRLKYLNAMEYYGNTISLTNIERMAQEAYEEKFYRTINFNKDGIKVL